MAIVELRHVWKRFGTIAAVQDFSLATEDGEFIVLVGPSGCGKTSTMRMIAGLETVSEGVVLFDSEDVTDQLPRSRDIAMVFQNYALFPHLDVAANLAFGLQLRKVPKAEIEDRVKRVVRTLGIEDLLHRRPKELSGGQRQRVALGRAIMREPRVFLMDEPLSNLDAALRMEMRAEIIKLQDRLGVTTFYVTHDQVEALSMGDRVVVMRSGQVQQVGTPMDLYERPANAYVARFIGSPPMNILAGRADGERLRIVTENTTLPLTGSVRGAVEGAGSPDVLLGVRPEHIMLSPHPGDGGVYSIEGTVDTVEPLGHTVLVRTRLRSEQHVNVLLGGRAPWRPGEPVHLSFRPENVYLFDGRGDRLLRGIET